jgi:hypothetical protein
MTGDVPVAGVSGVVPAQGIGGMQAMPLFPGLLEIALGGIDGEVDVAEVVRFATRKRAQEDNAKERRPRGGLGELQDARPLTQALSCAPPRPVVESNHGGSLRAVPRAAFHITPLATLSAADALALVLFYQREGSEKFERAARAEMPPDIVLGSY